MQRETKDAILKILEENIKNPKTELVYNSDFELLVAVMLSAQCTDKRVNMVTKEMFKSFNTPSHFANMPQEKLEQLIHSCGFYKNKAKNIIAMSKQLELNFDGQVPRDFKSLCALPGVGQKTANVMLIVAFNTPAIPVDTHIFRVSNRLGLSNSNNVKLCEEQLKKEFLYIKEKWGDLHHLILLFGRYVCKAINPDCKNCYLAKYCKHYKQNNQQKEKNLCS